MNWEYREPTVEQIDYLKIWNLEQVGKSGWIFIRKGIKYDLSAADFGQIERIIKTGLFVVES